VLTGWSITETEPEWDDQSRAEAVALVQFEGMTHHPCGQPLDIALSTAHGMRVHSETCQACRAMYIVRERYHEEHKDKDGKSDADRRVWWVEPIPLPDTHALP
jgi:hypothetical protein